MQLSTTGLNLIKSLELLRVHAYQDVAGVWTIGYGHTGPDVHPLMTITQQRADELLSIDTIRFQNAVRRTIQQPLMQHQFDALVCFAFNVGDKAFMDSTLSKLVNIDPFNPAIGSEFNKWIYAHKHGEKFVVKALADRRRLERALYFGNG